MSLNGLDDAKLAEAYAAVSAEPGGWFLVKYASRDEITLLGRGNGGIVEVRNAVAEYDETSPLYGFLKYRRRNVIIKYLPDGCSRLIQARVAVHFNAVCERFSPYDITFDIADADELRDTKLSAACSLHAASNSNTSSTSSLRKKRLGEIAEEDEDEQRATKRQSLHKEDEEKTEPVDPVTLNAELATEPEQSKFSAANTSELPNFVGVGSERPSTSSAATAAPSIDTSSRRLSSQTLRPDLFSYSSYNYGKPKVKLGPRPSLDVGPRPQTAGNFRPVSTIPAGLKLFGKGSKKGKSKDRDDTMSLSSPQEEVVEITFAPSPGAGGGPDGEAVRPNTSSGVSTVSTIMSAPMLTPAKGTVSREKARLMKAKQLREKKKKQSMMLSEPPTPTTPNLPTDTSPMDASPDAPSTETDALPTETAERMEETSETAPQPEHSLSMIKADSGVVLETLASVPTDQSSEQTHTDSRPTSPVVEPSEPDQSTKASSLSESTDETVQAKGEDVPKEDALEKQEREVAERDDEGESDETARPPSALGDEASSEMADGPLLEAKVYEGLSPVEKPAESKPVEVLAKIEPAHIEETRDEPEAVDATSAVAENETPVVAEVVQEPVIDVAKEEAKEEPAAMAPEVEATVDVENKPDESSIIAQDTEEKVDSEPEVDEAVAEPVVSLPITATELDTPEEASIAPAEACEAQGTHVAEEGSDEQSEGNFEAAIANSVPTPDVPEQRGSIRPETLNLADASTVPDDAPISPRLLVPKSKFSTQDLRNASPAAEEILAEDTPAAPVRNPKRRTFVEPIRTDLSPHSRNTSRSDFSVDEDLMEELHSATVEEAKPMTVAKTPISSVFPSDVTMVRNPGPSMPQAQPSTPLPKPTMVRTVSNPLRGPLITPTDVSQSSARSVSMGAAYLNKVTQQQNAGSLAKKANMGSGISQRIKALEMLSAETAAQKAAAGRGDRPSSTFFSVKKGRDPSRSPSLADRANSFGKQTPPSGLESRDSSPETAARRRRDRSTSIGNRLSIFESPPGAPGSSKENAPRGRPESISVTAKIIRDPHQNIDGPRGPGEYNHLALRQSPLLVDHQKASESHSHERRSSRDSRRSESQDHGKESKSRRSSLSIVKDFIKERRKSITSSSGDVPAPLSGSRSPTRPPSTHHNSGISHRLSMSSRRSLSRDRDVVLSPSAMTESSLSGDESKSTSGDKRKSRAGRFMRRLSSLSNGPRKNSTLPGISPTVTEEDLTPEPSVMRPSTTGTPAIVSYLGDVNVQFPDNLLWKRRNMCLDASGFLMLSALPAQSSRAAAQQGTKRYHLSEFRAPYVPDVEVQELPNSVVLDLKEGSGVQVACEDRAGQMAILQVLQEAHAAHADRYGL